MKLQVLLEVNDTRIAQPRDERNEPDGPDDGCRPGFTEEGGNKRRGGEHESEDQETT